MYNRVTNRYKEREHVRMGKNGDDKVWCCLQRKVSDGILEILSEVTSSYSSLLSKELKGGLDCLPVLSGDFNSRLYYSFKDFFCSVICPRMVGNNLLYLIPCLVIFWGRKRKKKVLHKNRYLGDLKESRRRK